MSRYRARGLVLRAKSHYVEWIVGLALVFSCAGLVAAQYHLIDLGRKRAAVAQVMTAPLPRIEQTEESLTEAGMLQLSQQIALINRDWNGLLESLVPEDTDTRLLSVDVNPVTGAVLVSGNAPNGMRANAYAELIEKRGPVAQVRLVSLELKERRTIFEVSGRWAE